MRAEYTRVQCRFRIIFILHKNIFVFAVGIDVEINLRPANHEEQTKESTSEEIRTSESLLKIFPTLLQPIKVHTFSND